jgi:hypothetical protein
MSLTNDNVHKAIIRKFGKVSKFARLARLNRYDLQKLFSRKNNTQNELGRITHLVEVTRVRPQDGDLTPAKAKRLATALKQAGGVIKFCRDNPQFAEQTVFQVLSGRRKRMTPKVKELFDYFKI